ncbi:MAG: hypothetical protein OJF49_004034 [Ktedonobacterales bacterium]|jgi:hypothetical protein|nr:MAG: hypothetical protein OJF49_004034 [Ktedonobacterales bacterium]
MRKILALSALPVVAVIALLVALVALPALAAPSHATTHRTSGTVHGAQPSMFAKEHPHGTKATVASFNNFKFSCSQPNTRRIINVTQKIINDADSGQGGNYWAFDTVTRTIQVWNIGPDTYCATVMYNGSFQAISGQESPGTGGILTGDEYGSMHGGYVSTTFTAQLNLSNPTVWPANGKVNGGNPTDYQCDVNGNCPGFVDWSSMYFSNISGFDLSSWGWIYHGLDHADSSSTGTWVNASNGNTGDILDRD